MFVVGIDGCRHGWIAFKVDLASLSTSELVDLPAILKNKPDGLATVAIDIPIGLVDGSRACDKAARKLGNHAALACSLLPAGQPFRRRITPPRARRTAGSREEV